MYFYQSQHFSHKPPELWLLPCSQFSRVGDNDVQNSWIIVFSIHLLLLMSFTAASWPMTVEISVMGCTFCSTFMFKKKLNDFKISHTFFCCCWSAFCFLLLRCPRANERPKKAKFLLKWPSLVCKIFKSKQLTLDHWRGM